MINLRLVLRNQMRRKVSHNLKNLSPVPGTLGSRHDAPGTLGSRHDTPGTLGARHGWNGMRIFVVLDISIP